MRIALFLFATILTVTPNMSEANICGLLEPCEDCVKFNGEVYSDIARVDDCKLVEVLKRGADFCYSDKFGVTKCPPSKEGDVFKLEPLKNKGLLAAALDIFVWYMEGAPRTEYGGKGLTEDYGLPEFPNGRILLIVDELVLAIETSRGDVESFTVYESKSRKPLASRIDQSEKSIYIQSSQFTSGGRYTWRVVIGGKKFGGKFSIAKAKARKRFADALQESMKGSANKKSTRYFISAIVARKKGYSFDAAQAIKASKRAKQSGI